MPFFYNYPRVGYEKGEQKERWRRRRNGATGMLHTQLSVRPPRSRRDVYRNRNEVQKGRQGVSLTGTSMSMAQSTWVVQDPTPCPAFSFTLLSRPIVKKKKSHKARKRPKS